MSVTTTRDAEGADSVLIEHAGPVSHVVLNRPEVKNAVNLDLAESLSRALEKAAGRARVIVIRGAGSNFSVGGDFDEVSRLRGEGTTSLRRLFDAFGRACSMISELPVPVVAAVEGYAMAGGFELMQACDIAVVHTGAVLADNHINFGQVPGGGGSQRLPRLIGRQRALGHILTGDRLTAQQAVDSGLAYKSAAPAEFGAVVAALADQLAAKDADALCRSKRLIWRGLEVSLEDGLELERRTIVDHLQQEGAAEGIAEFHRRRAGRDT